MQNFVQSVLSLPVVQAAVSQGGWEAPTAPGLSTRSVSEVLLTFIDWSIIMIGLLGVIVFIYAGFNYLTAQGETPKIEQAKRIMIYAIVGIAVSVLGLVAVRTVDSILKGRAGTQGQNTASNPSTSPETKNSQGLTEKPISELINNSRKGGPLSAILPKNTTTEDLKEAFADLSEGDTLTFSDGDSDILTVKKENGAIKILSFDEEKLREIQKQGSLRILPSFLVKEAKASPIPFPENDNTSPLPENDNTSPPQLDGSLLPIGTSLSLEDFMALIIEKIPILRILFGREITVTIDRPPLTPPPVSPRIERKRCFNSGGVWFRFSNYCEFEKNKCGGTQCLDSVFSPLDGCKCPEGSCLDGNGSCVLVSPEDDPCKSQSACFRAGGYWNENFASTGAPCPCIGYQTFSNQNTNSWVGPENPERQLCESSGGTWIFGPRPFPDPHPPRPPRYPRKPGCVCTCSGCYCWDENGNEITDTAKMAEMSVNTGAVSSLDECDVSSSTEPSMETGSSNTFSNYPDDASVREKRVHPQPFRSRRGYCFCPTDTYLGEDGRCTPHPLNPPAPPYDKRQACEDSGGTWKGGYCFCPTDTYLGEDGRCTPHPLNPPAPPSSCKIGSIDIGKMLGLADFCLSLETVKSNCTSSGGRWMEHGYENPAMRKFYVSKFCGTETKAIYQQINWEDNPDGTGGIGVNYAYPYYSCTCSSENQCLDDNGKCVSSSGTTVKDCGSDYNCFYNELSAGRKAKMTINETNSWGDYQIKETSEIRGMPRGNQFDVTMTVLKLEKALTTKALAGGVVSGETLQQCPALIHNLHQIEGKSATCVANSATDAKYLAQNGLTKANISTYSCYGNLINKINEICGTYPDLLGKKPAVYLYPEEKSTVEVNVKVNGSIVKSDPDYGFGWKVSAEPNGLIDGKLDYLSYEASLRKIELPEEGWVVEKKDLESWFDENLPKLGLNEKEKMQFKEYWLPELSMANFYEIKLLDDQFLKENMDLIVSPQPDTVIRRIFYFKPLAEKIDLKEPTITTPERKGFTVVEWGGIME